MRHFRFNLRFLALLIFALVFTVPHLWSSLFYQGYYYPKKIFIEFIIALAAFALAFEKKIRLPEKRILLISAVLLGLKILVTLMNFNWVTFFSLTDAIAFGVLCIYFATAWKNHQLELPDTFWIFSVSGVTLCAVTIWQFINSRIFNGDTNPLFFSGVFGNINMLTEYLVLALPLGLYLQRKFTGWRSYVIQFIVIAWIFFILTGQSRSTWISLAFCLAYLLYIKPTFKEWTSFGIAILLFTGTWFLPYQGANYVDAKKVSVTGRMEIYRGTSKMLLDNPLGVGGGQFEYNYFPYQLETTQTPRELVRYESPHSEPIKWGIENGWAFLLVNGIWWLAMLLAVWKIPAPRELQAYYRMSFAVIIPQMLFQFPFDNPASLMIMAFTFGMIFLAANSQEHLISKSIKYLILLAAVFYSVRATTQAANKWIDSKMNTDKEATRIGCEIDPSNWRVCFYHEMILIQSAYPADAYPIAKSQLQIRPFEFHSLRVAGLHFFIQGEIKKACEAARLYDMLFKGDSYFTPIIDAKCKDIPSAVTFENAHQFNRDYRNWLKTQL